MAGRLQAYSLHATHKVTSDKRVVLYTLLVRHVNTGMGYPVAYLLTNDQSCGPLIQWLNFLKTQSDMQPEQITIDICPAESLAIQRAFPNVDIRYCSFHVIWAWKTQLQDKVNLTNTTNQAIKVYRKHMENQLRRIVCIVESDEFDESVELFLNEHAEQTLFLDYFKSNWLNSDGNAHVLQTWSKAYHSNIQHNHMDTNNYVESWHNQLKTIYLQRKRNQRLDRLIHILVKDVEYAHRATFERVSRQIGRSGPIHRDLARRRYLADVVPLKVLQDIIFVDEEDTTAMTWKIASSTTDTFSPSRL
jgi:hypothetical protein